MSIVPIKAGNLPVGDLIPVTEMTWDLVDTLTMWRNEHRHWFLDTRPVTPESTEKWLTGLLADPKKHLFLIADSDGVNIGTYGWHHIMDGVAELTNLVRGRPGGHPRLIYYAEIALLRWLFSQGYKRITGECLAHNDKVMRLHLATGFRVTGERAILFQEGVYRFPEDGETGDQGLLYIENTPLQHATLVNE